MLTIVESTVSYRKGRSEEENGLFWTKILRELRDHGILLFAQPPSQTHRCNITNLDSEILKTIIVFDFFLGNYRHHFLSGTILQPLREH